MAVLLTSYGITSAKLKNLVRYFNQHKAVVIYHDKQSEGAVLKAKDVYESLGYKVLVSDDFKTLDAVDVVHIVGETIESLAPHFTDDFVRACLALKETLVVTEKAATVLASSASLSYPQINRVHMLTTAVVYPDNIKADSQNDDAIQLVKHQAYYEQSVFKTII